MSNPRCQAESRSGMRRTFAEALAERPLFFEPLPPSARSPPARIQSLVEEEVRLLAAVPRLDAVDVPELVDENHEGRPYYRSLNPPEFARTVGERAGCEAVVNKVVAHLTNTVALAAWTRTTIDQGVKNFVLVGGSSRYIPYPGPSVAEANRICHPLIAEAGSIPAWTQSRPYSRIIRRAESLSKRICVVKNEPPERVFASIRCA
ncbi:MAG: hypothetical protein L3J87_05565, partial [Thermoplasmata archaeon]|nr:hypothetical protein [Thermoplasmata archaeon]